MHVMPCTVAVACQGWDVKQVCPCNRAVRYFWKPEYGSRKPFSAIILSNLCLEIFESTSIAKECSSWFFCLLFLACTFSSFLSCHVYLKIPSTIPLTVEGMILETQYFINKGGSWQFHITKRNIAKWRSCIRYSGSTRNHPIFTEITVQ